MDNTYIFSFNFCCKFRNKIKLQIKIRYVHFVSLYLYNLNTPGVISKHNMFYVYSDFTIKAITDIERFQNQRVTDLKETLTSYAFLELKTAKKVR